MDKKTFLAPSVCTPLFEMSLCCTTVYDGHVRRLPAAVQEDSRRFTRWFRKDQEGSNGSRKFKKDQEGSKRFKKVQ